MRLPRRAVWVSALAIGAFQIVGSIGAANNQPERRSLDTLAVGLLLAGPIALAWRDRWPLMAVVATATAANVYVGRGYPFGPIFVGVAVALFWAVQAGHRRWTWALAAAGFAGFVVASLVDPRADGGPSTHLVLVAGWLAVVIAISELVRVNRAQVTDRRQAEREVHRRQQGEQRLMLAQELHDVLAHNISLINVQASVALHLLDEQPDQARPALTSIKAASHDSLRELRTALDVLRRGEEAPRAPAPRLADLDALVAGVRASGLEVRLHVDGPSGAVDTAVELAAYRIVQEALTNVTRHAHATVANVHITHGDTLTIEVTDNGTGGSAVSAVATGNGIVGIHERAIALGGTVDAAPQTEGGFRVWARLPRQQR